MNVNLITESIPSSFFGPQDHTLVAWLGMAGALVNTRGTVILIDPLLSLLEGAGPPICEAGYRLKLPLPVDARHIPHVDWVLYTHADDDHFGRLTAKRLADRLDCRFLAPAPVARGLIEMNISPDRIQVASDDDCLRQNNLEIIVTPAQHDWQDENPWQRGDCCGYLLRTPDGAIWHPGDTRLIDELSAIHDVDVLFFDVADVDAHLGPSGSARLAATSGAKALIAYHYGTFDLPPGSFASCDPDDARPQLNGLAARFLTLNPGQPLHLPLEK